VGYHRVGKHHLQALVLSQAKVAPSRSENVMMIALVAIEIPAVLEVGQVVGRQVVVVIQIVVAPK